jgi:trans-AT polyketide synthase/acyltransferase/oxidoreductase domain-containing protein
LIFLGGEEDVGNGIEKINSSKSINAQALGSREFRESYNLEYAYYAGSMVRGISSKEMVVRMGRAGMMCFLGSGSMPFPELEDSIRYIQAKLAQGGAYGVNLLHNPNDSLREEQAVDILLKQNVQHIEASAFMSVTPALVKFHAKGLKRESGGKIVKTNKILAKLSRPEVAEAFLSPAPESFLKKLLIEGKITEEEAELSRYVPVADDVCVEADSGGHTDGGVAIVLLPTIMRLRDNLCNRYKYEHKVCIGLAGGIGTPEAAAAAFIMGADFIATGSINQCTVEAGTSDSVKDLLQDADIQDMEYAPAGDMFELGAKVQVFKKGIFFPARANKLFDLYRKYNSIDEIDEKTKQLIQDKYFKRRFNDIYEDCKVYFNKLGTVDIQRAEQNSKHKMALIFRWYFGYSNNLALKGIEENKVDYQINCGPALGAFNQWVKGTELENWRNRHVDEIALKIIHATSEVLESRCNLFINRLSIQ